MIDIIHYWSDSFLCWISGQVHTCSQKQGILFYLHTVTNVQPGTDFFNCISDNLKCEQLKYHVLHHLACLWSNIKRDKSWQWWGNQHVQSTYCAWLDLNHSFFFTPTKDEGKSLWNSPILQINHIKLIRIIVVNFTTSIYRFGCWSTYRQGTDFFIERNIFTSSVFECFPEIL